MANEKSMMSNRLHTYHIASMEHLRSLLVAAALTLCGSTALAGVKVTGSVYGGGNQANVGETEVNVKAGEIVEAVYGGCNSEGTVSGNAVVTLTGGTVGTVPGEGEAIGDAVFGGGRGEPTLVNGNVTVNVGTLIESTYTGNAIIHGNVYGGSALGNTNGSFVSEVFTPTENKNTKVYLYAGTINGSAFGGGLGRKAAAAVLYTAEDAEVIAGTKTAGDVKTEAVTAVESFVGGNVNVLLDGAKVHQVFGCNNLNGTPKGHVKVHVKQTNNFSGNNDYKNNSTTALDNRTTYDVTAVYGGGNQADYNPTKATGTDDDKKEAFAEVLIEGCDKTSIEYVYGGGNAAAVPATKVTVESAYIIHQLFGGGNGAGEGNPGADVGVIDRDAYEADHANGIYGTGETKIELIGGQVHEVYGGSNTKGNVRGGTSLKRKDSNTCTLKIGAIYGAGQEAPMDGNVNIVLECMPEEYVAQVFGGAKNAEIKGDVSLTVTSGKYGQVFGGNNIGGSINGSITVNVYEDGCLPLIIGELYGGGFKAPYSVFGCTREGNTWTANESGTTYYGTDTQDDRDNIQVNVYSCTSIGKIFGGGYQAPVIGNTHVWVNMMKGLVDDPDHPGERKENPIGKIARIFGGGNEAAIKGNTLVDIGTVTALDHYDPTTPTYDIGVNIEGGSYLKPVKDENNSEDYETLTAGIYGGGNAADVEGNTTLNIGTANQKVGDEPSIKIQSDIFGGGFGESTNVTGNVVVNIGKKTETTVDETTTYSYEGYAEITGDVYGGSAKGKVNSTDNGSTKVNFYGGIIKDTETPSGKGNIYGGGLGEDNEGTENDHAADVNGPVTVTLEKGSTTNTVVNNVFGCNNVLGTPKNTVTVNINGGTVNHSVYGGGNRAAYTPTVELAENAKIYPAVNINNGTITENVFGGGLGTTATVTGNPHVTIGDTNGNHTAAVGGSVYGGGDAGDIHGNTLVKVLNTNTTIAKNVFGAGKGRDDTFTCAEAMVGEEEAGNACVEPDAEGYKDKGTKVVINNGTIGTLSEGTLVEGTGNVYGGGEIGRVEWNTQVEIGVGTGSGTFAPVIEGCVFGAGKGLETHGYAALVRGNSYVTIGGDAKIGKNVYGGGEISTVGRYWVKDIPVTPCEGEEVPTAPTDLPAGMPYLMRRGGKSVVTIQEKAAIGYHGVAEDAGHVFGAGRGINPHFVASGEGQSKKMNNNNELVGFDSEAAYLEFLETLALVSRSSVTINGCDIKGNVYGGSESGFVQTNSSVTIKGNSKIGTEGSTTYGNVFGGGKGLESFAEAGKVRGETVVDISDGKIYNNVYGGGQRGYVMQNVTVNVRGGQVVNDVYGGGALANTNTANWSTSASATTYEEVTGLTPATYAEESVEVGKSVEGLYIYEGDKYVAATGTAQSGTKYYKLTAGSSVAGYYTRSGSEEPFVYTLVTTGVADFETTYWRKKVSGTWAEGRNDPSTGTTYKTNVQLTGGLIGNVYGGGLGQLANGDNPAAEGYKPAIAAMVYGDVKVTVNDPSVIGTDPGVAFTQDTKNITYGEGNKRKEYVIPLTGRVFGCNNQNGTPTGNVRVEVYSTRQIDANNNIIPGHGSSNRKYPNEMRAVYGGGNLSDYLPADGKGTSVYVEGCDVTSIEKVYGGGNSASVPATDVTIHSCYDIGYAFGGGNGGDLINKNGEWIENEGAIVIGLAKITPKGGKIGQVFGGSDAKGVCGNTTVDLSQQIGQGCPLVLTRIYGAGNEADVSGDVNMIISGCGSGSQTIGGETVNTQIEYVYGGSYNAHITGNVTLTISSGLFKYVYGGNDRTGSIGGNITVNIEERDNCNPIIIENLLGGGNEAAYPGTRRDGTEITKAGKITVNVKSATYIGSVYGGSYKADVNGDTEVNINMTKGLWAGAQAPAGYSDLPNINHASYAKVVSPETAQIGNYYEKNGNTYTKTSDTDVNSSKTYYVAVAANTDVIDDAVGVIGTVYGGGNQGVVRGSSVVNIGTSTTVPVIDFVTTDAEGKITNITYKNATVFGARITGDVFGGGNEANINKDATVNICTVVHSGTTGFEGINIEGGSVYGGGNASDVLGNTNVTMRGGYVFDGVYGGGLHGNVGTFTRSHNITTASNGIDHNNHTGCVEKPTACTAGGTCTVVVTGGQIGPVEVVKDGGGMKNTNRYFIKEGDDTEPVDYGFVFGAGRGAVENPYVDLDADFHSYVNKTDVTIGGTAFIMASVYGGGENGRVLGDTHVTIEGNCQIGCGEGKIDSNNKPVRYTDAQWSAAAAAITSGVAADINAAALAECPHWDYTSPYYPHDPYGTGEHDAALTGTDGHTYFGNVFGGGSGYFPYKKADGTHDWVRSAGWVEGNTVVDITGGHILTNVYGGNEMTNVGRDDDATTGKTTGKCTVNMSGGTIGVPRTLEQIAKHPVTCYLFGAGQGDQRTHFNTWTNVNSTDVNVTGGIIYGSVFGGGEDGHILENASVTISGTAHIGTWGTSYVDGNVFGGGRGFSGLALTAGSTGGNVDVTISGGTMLGSIYGGGRLASVGTYFTAPEADEYGQLKEDETGEGAKTYGHITVNISGGTIGGGIEGTEADKTAGYCDMKYSGNVYGGCMGRTTLIDGETINPLWPELAQSKFSTVNIYGDDTHITRNVYGGAEFGVVRENATVTINGGTIGGYVYGGGHGSDDYQHPTTIEVHWGGTQKLFTYTPMQWTGCVGGNTTVNLAGGTVKRIYGGGELASVGVIDYGITENANGEFTYKDKKYSYTNLVKHDSKTTDGNTFYDFGLSWPYKFTYVPCNPSNFIGGLATVNVTGNAAVTELVYGGGKGQVAFTGVNNIEDQRYTEAFCANVRNTQVTIGTSGGSDATPTIGTETTGSIYGGGEDGHVYENANVTIHHGTITHTVFGGGKGVSTYEATLLDPAKETPTPKGSTETIHSWTAGKVYGNTTVTVNGGSIGWFVYGGGNMASVGKGNYTGGSDDYSTAGYGELPSTDDGAIWTATPAANSYADYFQNSGIATVNILGGTIGDAAATAEQAFTSTDKLPYGSVFGGSRGTAAMDVGALSPRYKYVPDFFLGYVNKAKVNIGGTEDGAVDGDGPTIYGSVYGGAQDGHVRNSTEVRIFKGDIAGRRAAVDAAGRSGHVFGAGSGIGTYDTNKVSYSSGSVTCTTLVEMNGGSIHGNIWGGGAMSSVGPPRTVQSMNEQHTVTSESTHKSVSYTRVDVKGGTVGGNVYGASRGPSDAYLTAIFETVENYDKTKYATDIWSDVNISGGTIGNNVYGGGQGGIVKESTTVSLTGGKITHDAYGGGQGTANIAADILGNTTTELNKGVAAKGCVVDKVYGCNDLNGTPKGHVLVHVYATQTSGGESVSTKAALPPSYSANKASDEGYIVFMEKLIEDVTKTGGLKSDDPFIVAARATIDGKSEGSLKDLEKTAILTAAEDIDDAMNGLYDLYGYDVAAVYGGGDLAPYEPTSDAEKTEVIIEGCGTTSIKQVYGGGNAASVPATDVTVKSCYIIGELFGGGNGKDNYVKDTDGKWYENPGAHIGYKQYAYYVTDGSQGTGIDEANKYKALVPSEADGNTDAAKAYRQEHYRYGTGVASSIINGGHVHKSYGGSNEKGNISGEINSQLQQVGTCTIVTDGTYGGSKSADTDATIIVVLDCVEEGKEFYGGSYKANVNSDVNIHITNGHYTKVFGGNDRAGTVNGKITITIEEYGCTPIEIDELYAGGNLAPYSVYGFKTETQKAKDANGNDIADLDQRIPYRAGEVGARTTPYWDPRINIISATRIGAIYGGGYGAGATLIGNPHINVNMTEGKIRSKYNDYKTEYATLYPTYDGTGEDKNRVIPIGTIGSIYGGGNLASVEGDTYLEIGTGQWIASWDDNGNPVWESTTANGDKYSYKEKVPAVYYSQAECNEYNSNPANNVTGYIASGTELSTDQVEAVKKALGTSYVAGAELMTKDANAYNATLTGARKTTDVKTPAVHYTQDEINAAVEGDDAYGKTTSDIKTPAVYYTQAECDEYNKTHCTHYIAKHTKLTAAQANSVNTALTPSYNTNDAITPADANAYNATLPNARKTTDVRVEAVWAWYDANGAEVTTPLDLAPRNAATITGNVFGGGKGVAETTGSTAFTCPKGMVGVDGDGIDYPEGGTSVVIANGTVGTLEGEEGSKTLKAGTGNVYGGGEVGRVEKNTVVTIGMTPKEGETIDNTKFKPTIYGNVFGAGKGVETHGYSALVRGNSTVTIQGFAKVGESVYGGGEIASVGRYNVVDGRPTSLKNPNSGNCIVTVRDNAEIGPDNMTMFHVNENGDIVDNDQPDNSGHVFGAGKGAMPGDYKTAKQMTNGNTLDGFTSEDDYLKFIESLGLATQTKVTIGGNAFVKGDIFGGAEQGFVQHDTHVIIEGNCQIGNGYVQMDDDGTYLAEPYSLNRRYTPTEWTEGRLYKDGETNYTSSLPECASWLYGQATGTDKYAFHDMFDGTSGYDSKGGRKIADNGSTFYGNVFGGGSGYFPYKAGSWHEKAGDVGGNTVVDIKGGHILTNVYGGNELTNVGRDDDATTGNTTGKCTVNMSGGTIGVPRTLGQIAAHPVTCYLFGGGKGDARVLFNKMTNVKDVVVNITGGWIYGSAFGGGEDGHVLRNTTLNISSKAFEGTPAYADYYAGRATKIGTWGTSYVDGNIFGGGRGFTGDAYTAGNVAGAVTMNIAGGEILGSVYGGGRLGSVGYGLYDEKTPSGDPTPGYGEMREDHKLDNGSVDGGFFTKGRGHVDISISGGTIGNDHEYVFVPSGTTEAQLTTLKNDNYMPNTEFVFDNDKNLYRLSHTKGGNVFAGGMGRLYQLDGETAISAVDWWKLGNVKSTKLTITGGTIKSNVYGGGEMGMVQGTHTSADSKSVSTEIIINGGTIGTEIKETVTEGEAPNTTTTEVTRYTFGSIYGGGYGSIEEKLTHGTGTNAYETYPKYIAGRVKGSTEVTMTDGTVKASVYGGGEMAAVGESKVLSTSTDPVVKGETLTGAEGKAMDGNTYVTISGGTVGINRTTITDGDNVSYIYYGGATMGNVYGGGSGYINTVRSGHIYGNTNVAISQAEGKTTRIYHNIYGGGAYGTVGDFTYTMTDDTGTGTKKVTGIIGLHNDRTGTGTANVTIEGGTIGVDGHENGMVFGSSRGDVDEPGKRPDFLAWVNNANVTIGDAKDGTNASGNGKNLTSQLIKGSVYGSGENGHTYNNTRVDIHSGTIGDPAEFYAYRGNVYGGGCGTDTYTVTVNKGEANEYSYEAYNKWAGIVRGNTEVNIDGGLITGCIYGAGAMASVGTITNAADTANVNKAKHYDITNPGTDSEVIHGFALSWPYEFVFDENTGKATINITGGHIGIDGTDGGDVYGSARGEADDRYVMAHHAFVKESEVNVKYPTTADVSDISNPSVGCITGSVHGSGENGYVYGDTHVTLHKGLIGHSLYGAGKGIGTYKKSIPILAGAKKGTLKERDIYGLLSGKVLGNTYVTMNDGLVVRNVYGGGNMASVGKGNYAGGADDYYPDGYGETLTGNLWDNESDESKAFFGSGKTNIRVLGGTVGDISNPTKIKNGLPYGNVIGGCAGEPAPNVFELPRYQYCPAFFSGYVNETDVTIGGYRCKAGYNIGETTYKVGDCITAAQYNALASGKDNWEQVGPTILASVYGGGQDGHVRRDTKVTINSGEIGLPYNEFNRNLLDTKNMSLSEELDNPQWLFRGNVFGGGSGVNKYKFDFDGDGEYTSIVKYGPTDETMVDTKEEYYSNSSGSVTRFTEVNIYGGTIHRNVYGGGSLGSIGAPKILETQGDLYKKDLSEENKANWGKQSQNTVNIGGGASVVTIGTPTDYNKVYGGEVYGACRGKSDLDPEQFANSIWTKVNIFDKATIMGNVYGGGDNGIVKKDSEVIIGGVKQ